MLTRKKSTTYLEDNPFVLSENRKTIPVRIWLDNVRSALNVGSAFRTSDALGIEKLYLSGITQQPPHKEILKTALGKYLRNHPVPIFIKPCLLSLLRLHY